MEPPFRRKKHRLTHTDYFGQVRVALTLCVEGRQVLFSRVEVVDVFLNVLTQSVRKHRSIVPAYCFMPDHLHLLIAGVEDYSRPMAAALLFKQRTGFWLKQNRVGMGWQPSFHDHKLRCSDDYRKHAAYIFANPYRAGLLRESETYPFSGTIDCDLSG